ncbi:MAG: uracil-DNA glycosylase [Gammaproteobacteria bacterium]|nr:uracil-DNA glycosylase [Gammaproteobacteria bacterium]
MEQKHRFPCYHCLPVAGFGSPDARLLVIGLAPGLHGANATGRPFTGDASGDLLFATLHKYGFASSPDSRVSSDNMRLIDCRITNAVKCVPPGNRPTTSEINHCKPFLGEEIAMMMPASVLLALGTIAHRAILKALDLTQARYRFYQHAEYELPNGLTLIDSFHPSRYNQNTGKITPGIFEEVFDRIRLKLQ